MSFRQGFAPVVGQGARVLILGSMPGQKSLDARQYYAHPRNCFWWIISELLETEARTHYTERCNALIRHRICLWDVCFGCEREGSLDSRINKASVEANNFSTFFSHYPEIRHVFFNGRVAEKLFKQQVFSRQAIARFPLTFACLPSTSPAHASMSAEQKLAHWSVIKAFVQ